MQRKIGRPLKYPQFLQALEDREVYTPASIARLGEEKGLLEDIPPEQRKSHCLKIRHTLARMSTNQQFPQGGDGTVFLRGQQPSRGWFGSRWKDCLRS